MQKLLILFLVTLTALGCKNESQVDYAIFSGQISNPIGEEVVVSGNNNEFKIAINTDGTFSDTLKISSGYYDLRQGRESSSVFLSPGYELNLTLDTKEFDESISYTGIGSEVNNYLATKYLNNEKLTQDRSALYSLEEVEFKEKLETIKNSNLELLKTTSSLDINFNELEIQNLNYEFFAALGIYESYHEYYAKKEGFKVSDNFFPEDYKALTFNDEKAYQTFNSYKRMAMTNVTNKIYEHIGEDYQNASVDHFAVLNDVPIQLMKDDVIKSVGGFLVSPGNPNMSDLYEFFMVNLSDEDYKTKLTEKFNKNKGLVRGMPSPEFTDYENHKGGTMSLADLKGKYVYVDVWATWCGPCKREIPYLKEVEGQYHDKNIEFVSTSIDKASDHDAWVQMVNDLELGGIQLFAENDWNSEFVKNYAIEGIPRFILIDPNGNIVSADAPRPSNPKLIELFTELKL